VPRTLSDEANVVLLCECNGSLDLLRRSYVDSVPGIRS
jgi:hypothetical protein